MEKKKQPKETDAIRKKLDSYAALQRKIDNQIERLANLTATMGSVSSPNFSGLPSGSGDGTSKTERQILRKMALEEKIRDMEQEERQLRRELEALIDAMQNPDEQTVIEMRYIDRAKWWPICAALYSMEDDYEENSSKYLKRTFKLHGSALQSIARIYKAETPAEA
ncbi:MAG: DUF1492 domain-containing protein [Lachnospiraceae bacterium]|nr:DUF1492 domain-containing protein [Lachnospiraceae bacterium]